jgi:membrane protease subunit (stomatin/prohibitin family)
MKGLLDKLNSANKIMNTANRTVGNVDSTKRNIDRLGDRNQKTKDKKAAAKALEWKCECGKKQTSKFCESCGKAKPACSKCGAADTGSKFCANCGTAME